MLEAGFEPDEPRWYATRLAETAEHTSFVVDSKVSRSGSSSVAIAIAPTHPQKRIAYNWTRALERFEPGADYELSGWIRTQGLSQTAWICVQSWGPAVEGGERRLIGFGTTQRAHEVSGTTDWTQVRTRFTVPPGTEEVRIRAGIAAPENAGGRAWFDDIRVVASADG